MYRNSRAVERKLWRHHCICELKYSRCYSTKKELGKFIIPEKNKDKKRHVTSQVNKNNTWKPVIVPKIGVLYLFYKNITNKIVNSVLHVIPNITKEENISKLADFRFNEEVIQRYVELKKKKSVQTPTKCLEDPGPLIVQYEYKPTKHFKKDCKSGMKFFNVLNLASTLEKNYKIWKSRITKETSTQSDNTENLLLYDNLLKNAVIMDSVMPNIKAMYRDSNLFDFRFHGGITDSKSNCIDNEKTNKNAVTHPSHSKLKNSEISNGVTMNTKTSSAKSNPIDSDKKVLARNPDSPKTHNVKASFSPPPKRPLYKNNWARNEALIKSIKTSGIKESRKIPLPFEGNKLHARTSNHKPREETTCNQITGNKEVTLNEGNTTTAESNEISEINNEQGSLKVNEIGTLPSHNISNTSLPALEEESVKSAGKDNNFEEKEYADQSKKFNDGINNEMQSTKEPTTSNNLHGSNTNASYTSQKIGIIKDNMEEIDKNTEKLKENVTLIMPDSSKKEDCRRDYIKHSESVTGDIDVRGNSKTNINEVNKNIKSKISKPHNSTDPKTKENSSKFSELKKVYSVKLKVKDEDDVYFETRPQIISDSIKADHINLNIVIEEEESANLANNSKSHSVADQTNNKRQGNLSSNTKHDSNKDLLKSKEQTNSEAETRSSNKRNEVGSENNLQNYHINSGANIDENKQFVNREKCTSISSETVLNDNSNKMKFDKKELNALGNKISNSNSRPIKYEKEKAQQVTENSKTFDHKNTESSKFIKNISNSKGDNLRIIKNTINITKLSSFEKNNYKKVENTNKEVLSGNAVRRKTSNSNVSEEIKHKSINKIYMNTLQAKERLKDKYITSTEVYEKVDKKSKFSNVFNNTNEDLKTNDSETGHDNSVKRKTNIETESKSVDHRSQGMRAKVSNEIDRNCEEIEREKSNVQNYKEDANDCLTFNAKHSISEAKHLDKAGDLNKDDIPSNTLYEKGDKVNISEENHQNNNKKYLNNAQTRSRINEKPITTQGVQKNGSKTSKLINAPKNTNKNQKMTGTDTSHNNNLVKENVDVSESKPNNNLQDTKVKMSGPTQKGHSNTVKQEIANESEAKSNTGISQDIRVKISNEIGKSSVEILKVKPTATFEHYIEQKSDSKNRSSIIEPKSINNSKNYETEVSYNSAPKEKLINETEAITKNVQELKIKDSNQTSSRNLYLSKKIDQEPTILQHEQSTEIKQLKSTFGYKRYTGIEKSKNSNFLNFDGKPSGGVEHKTTDLKETKTKSSNIYNPVGNKLKKAKSVTLKGEDKEEVRKQNSTISFQSANHKLNNNSNVNVSDRDSGQKITNKNDSNIYLPQSSEISMKKRQNLRLNKFSPTVYKTKLQNPNEKHESTRSSSKNYLRHANDSENNVIKSIPHEQGGNKIEIKKDILKEPASKRFEEINKNDSTIDKTLKVNSFNLSDLQKNKIANERLKSLPKSLSDNLIDVRITTSIKDNRGKTSISTKEPRSQAMVKNSDDIAQKKNKEASTERLETKLEKNFTSDQMNKRKRLRLKEAPQQFRKQK